MSPFLLEGLQQPEDSRHVGLLLRDFIDRAAPSLPDSWPVPCPTGSQPLITEVWVSFSCRKWPWHSFQLVSHDRPAQVLPREGNQATPRQQTLKVLFLQHDWVTAPTPASPAWPRGKVRTLPLNLDLKSKPAWCEAEAPGKPASAPPLRLRKELCLQVLRCPVNGKAD